MGIATNLFVYPIKSCRGVAVDEIAVTDLGLDNDRRWMIVDGNGRFLTIRDFPDMVRIVPTVLVKKANEPVLHIVIAEEDGTISKSSINFTVDWSKSTQEVAVKVWFSDLKALDCGAHASRILSAFLGVPVRLVRFLDTEIRLCNALWTKELVAKTLFTDGYPLMVLAKESISDLSGRMKLDSLDVERFRPNILIDGLEAYEEDFIHEMIFEDGTSDPIVLRLVKPCPRCFVPRVHPRTGALAAFDPNLELSGYRMNAQAGGAVLGMKALAYKGLGKVLKTGSSFDALYAF